MYKTRPKTIIGRVRKEYQREYYQRRKHDREFMEKRRAYSRQWDAANPDKVKARHAAWYQRKIQRIGRGDG